MPKVSVRITWPEGVQLPDNAQALVTVEDVTAVDAPSVLVGETVLGDLDPSRPLLAEVDVDEVDAGSDLVVRVHVVDRSRADRQVEGGDLVTTETSPGHTRGHGDSVVVRPRQVG
jgi:hypothetical protein